MKTADFDYFLPEGMIASRPSEKRDDSRLLVLQRDGSVEHKRFHDITDYIEAGDMIIMNDTGVFPARISALKPDGRKLDLLFVKDFPEYGAWEVIFRGRFSGDVTIGDSIRAEIWEGTVPDLRTSRSEVVESGLSPCRLTKLLRFADTEISDVPAMLWKYGQMPLPPYIKRLPDEEDKRRYQTVYAKDFGSIAAPTAGLHFSKGLVREMIEKGVLVRTLTLHVGTGTFKPIKSGVLKDHVMDLEYFRIESCLMDELKRVKEAGKRIIMVGTTSTRAIEGYAGGRWSPVNGNGKCVNTALDGYFSGFTDIFIYPGFSFKITDCLVTNFHLPRSTPLMLASALCGFEKLISAYKEAIAGGYRFFSYGDAMLIL